MAEQSFEEILSSVIGNEELMSKVSAIAKAHDGNQDEALPEVIEAISSSFGKEESKKDFDNSKGKKFFDYSKNSKLLLALRPYLSEKRAHMIDTILKVEQIAEFMKVNK